MLSKLLSCIFLFIFVSNAQTDAAHAHETGGVHCAAVHEKPDWDECKDHLEQSPINIEPDKAKESDLCVSPFNWDIDYDHRGFKVENNGHTVQVTAVDPDADKTDLISSDLHPIATFKNIFEEEDLHKEYYLAQYHFHWGNQSEWGSEHTIDEKHFPLEVHFVHYASDDKNASDALEKHKQCVLEKKDCDHDGHSLGVIAILFDISKKDNPAFDAILSDEIVEQIQDYPSCTYVDDAKIKDLINNADKGGYYSYQGSLTTPPCFEIVRWFVMKKRSYVSEAQMERFRKIKRDPDFFEESGHSELGNFRPIQKHLEDDVINCGDDGSESDSNDDGDSDSSEEHGHSSGDSGVDANGDGDSDSEEVNDQQDNSNGQAMMVGDNVDDTVHSEINNVVSLSSSTLANLWAIGIFMFIGISLVNIILVCYWRSRSSAKEGSNIGRAKYVKADLEDQDIDTLDVN